MALKEHDVDDGKILISIKLRYKGEFWEQGMYVDPYAFSLSQVEREIEKTIIRLAKGVGGILNREDVSETFKN